MVNLVSRKQWKVKITASWQKAVTSIIETGHLLIQAKRELDRGEWLKLFEDKVPFSEDTAQRLMLIARHPILGNTAYTRHLPPSWYTLYELTKIPQITLTKMISGGEISPELEQQEAIALYKSTIEVLKPQPPRPSKPLPERPEPHINPPEIILGPEPMTAPLPKLPMIEYGEEHYVVTPESLEEEFKREVKRWEDAFYKRAFDAMTFPAQDWSKFKGKVRPDMIKEAQLVIDAWTRVKEYLLELGLKSE
jgi:hypothetical protein